MFKKLLSYIWTPKGTITLTQMEDAYKHATVAELEEKIIRDALAHYCEICDRGFQNRGATKTHKRFKHKE